MLYVDADLIEVDWTCPSCNHVNQITATPTTGGLITSSSGCSTFDACENCEEKVEVGLA